jgi:hypothetical protein
MPDYEYTADEALAAPKKRPVRNVGKAGSPSVAKGKTKGTRRDGASALPFSAIMDTLCSVPDHFQERKTP